MVVDDDYLVWVIEKRIRRHMEDGSLTPDNVTQVAQEVLDQLRLNGIHDRCVDSENALREAIRAHRDTAHPQGFTENGRNKILWQVLAD